MKAKQNNKKSKKFPFLISRDKRMSHARATRRSYLKTPTMRVELRRLKNCDRNAYFEYLYEAINQGNKFHIENVNDSNKFQNEQLVAKETSMRKHFKEIGYSKDKIDSLLSNWRNSILRNSNILQDEKTIL